VFGEIGDRTRLVGHPSQQPPPGGVGERSPRVRRRHIRKLLLTGLLVNVGLSSYTTVRTYTSVLPHWLDTRKSRPESLWPGFGDAHPVVSSPPQRCARGELNPHVLSDTRT